MITLPAGIYLLKLNNRNCRTRCEICLELTTKTPERPVEQGVNYVQNYVFIVNSEHISHLVVLLLFLTLNMSLPAGLLWLKRPRLARLSQRKFRKTCRQRNRIFISWKFPSHAFLVTR